MLPALLALAICEETLKSRSPSISALSLDSQVRRVLQSYGKMIRFIHLLRT